MFLCLGSLVVESRAYRAHQALMLEASYVFEVDTQKPIHEKKKKERKPSFKK